MFVRCVSCVWYAYKCTLTCVFVCVVIHSLNMYVWVPWYIHIIRKTSAPGIFVTVLIEQGPMGGGGGGGGGG